MLNCIGQSVGTTSYVQILQSGICKRICANSVRKKVADKETHKHSSDSTPVCHF